MNRIALCFLLFLFVGFAPALSQENKSLIVGGQKAGPFSLGADFSQVENRLGPPSSSQPTSGDPSTTLRFYQKYKLAFLVNGKSKIIGITVARKDWKTASGLGVGSLLSDFQDKLGRGLKRGRGQLAFPNSGLALAHSGGKVTTVFVVKADEVDKVKGDHLVIGGTRIGQLRLGNSSEDLQNLLGPPSQKTGQNKNVWVYAQRGIRLGFIQGRLHMVGVSTGDWVTPSGLKVGRPFADMKKEFGSDYRIQTSSVFFDKWGIGARLQGDQIVELLVFNPKKSDVRG